ncbi:MAG: Rid family hydrolase [Thiobacillaceae bacterium]
MVHDDRILSRSFRGATGGAEHFIVIKAPEAPGLKEQIQFLEERYQEALAQRGLSPETAVFRRIFLSDVLNQAGLVRESKLLDDATAVSIVQQPPGHGSKIELLAYHIESQDPVTKTRLSPRHLLVEKNKQRHLWSTRLCACDHETSISSEAQTREMFGDLVQTLSRHGATLRDHCVRTWIYMKDVDVFYKGMVTSRRDVFAQEGLTGSTHYIASTGIQGACAHRFDIVSMDAYSNLDLIPGQVTYLNDFNLLCATKDYNVHFERGTRVAYADRAHSFISGTASIDKDGEVVHLGDVIRQLERALENTDALLHSGAASLSDMMYLIVYLRDPADFARVDAYLGERFSDLPTVIVHGAVCRPAWLIEIEGVAITRNDEPAFPRF